MRTVVVGAGGGIGQSVCSRLEARGHTLVPLDRQNGVDAAQPASVREALEGVAEVHHLVHVAGTVGTGGIEDHSLDDWHRILDDNLTSAFVCAKEIIPRLVDGSGTITLSSSVTARTGGTRYSGPAYAAAKGAITTLTRYLASDLAPRGIRANAVAAGPVDTAMVHRLGSTARATLLEQIPLRRVTPPDEIAGAIAFLISQDARSITGTVLDVNGGMWMG